jgi:putative FmdB family regulatory protein
VPTYEYDCPKCPRVFELRQRITEAPLTTCDICGGPVRRLLSATPFILKGGGWYVTDYPSEGRKKGTKAESPSSDSGSGATSDSASEKSSTSSPAPSPSPGTDAAKSTKPDKPATPPASKSKSPSSS